MSGSVGQAAMALACEPLDTRLRRFQRSYRRRLRRLVRGSKPLSDLLYSFPAAAFVLAAGNRPIEARGRAVQLLKAGAPLPAVATTLALPWWLRRMPPEAFAAPFGSLPEEEDFGRRIVNLIPQDVEAAAMWFGWVAFGAEAGDSALALWLADKRIYRGGDALSLPLLPLVAFAWYSRQRDGVGYHLIEKPWHAKMPFKTAVAETRGWLERVIVEYCLEKRPGNGDWHKVSRACGYRFLPMRTPQELAEEGARMQNCVASYAYRVGIGACLIYSVRRGGTRVATLEVAPDPGQPLAARIAQLRGPANSPPADDVVRVAEAWLMRRGRYPIAIRRHLANLPIVPGSWQAIWRPFCAARPQFASTLLDSHTQGLLRLYTDLRKLEAFEEAR